MNHLGSPSGDGTRLPASTSARALFRHVYRNTEGNQVACSKHRNITETRAHQWDMLVTKPPGATRLTSLGAPVPSERKPRTRSARMSRTPKPLRTITADELARLIDEMPSGTRHLKADPGVDIQWSEVLPPRTTRGDRPEPR
jgi:hypothetical protein